MGWSENQQTFLCIIRSNCSGILPVEHGNLQQAARSWAEGLRGLQNARIRKKKNASCGRKEATDVAKRFEATGSISEASTRTQIRAVKIS